MRFALVVVLMMCAVPLRAQQLALGTISSYLNGLQSGSGAFTQINSDGTLSTGTIYIKRPGRMRFEYDPPERTKVIIGQGAVVIQDGKSNESGESYPLNRTPLSIILAERVDLGRANMVTGHSYDGTATIVRAQDPERPGNGTIDLHFTGNPVELRQWVVTDADGTKTTVVLGALNRGGQLSEALFNTRAQSGSDN